MNFALPHSLFFRIQLIGWLCACAPGAQAQESLPRRCGNSYFHTYVRSGLGISLQAAFTSLSTSGATFNEPFGLSINPGASLSWQRPFKKFAQNHFQVEVQWTQKSAIIPPASGSGIFPVADSAAAQRLGSHGIFAKPSVNWRLGNIGGTKVSLHSFLSFGFLFSQTLRNMDANSVVRSEFFHPFYAGAGLGLAFEFRLRQKWGWLLEPFFELQANPAYESSLYIPRFYSFGISFGIIKYKVKTITPGGNEE